MLLASATTVLPWSADPSSAGQPITGPAFFVIQATPPGPGFTGAKGISGDGSTLVGFSLGSMGSVGVRWTPATGVETVLAPPTPSIGSVAIAGHARRIDGRRRRDEASRLLDRRDRHGRNRACG